MGCLVGVWAWLGGLLGLVGGGVTLRPAGVSMRLLMTLASLPSDMYWACFCLRLPLACDGAL